VFALISPMAWTSRSVTVATAPLTALTGVVQRGSRANAWSALREHEERREAVAQAWHELEPTLGRPSPSKAEYAAG